MKLFKIMAIAFVLFVIATVAFNYCNDIWSGVAVQAALYSSVGNYEVEVVHRAQLLQNVMLICKIAAFGTGTLVIGCGVVGLFRIIFSK